MAKTDKKREEELRELLTDAIEVQLAALKAGIGFWGEWIEQTSAFVQSATNTLTDINSEDEPKEVLLELVDAGRASIRSMTELPRDTASRFIEALDEFEDKKKKRKKKTTTKKKTKAAAEKTRSSTASSSTRKTGAATKRTAKSPRKRAGRAKT